MTITSWTLPATLNTEASWIGHVGLDPFRFEEVGQVHFLFVGSAGSDTRTAWVAAVMSGGDSANLALLCGGTRTTYVLVAQTQ